MIKQLLDIIDTMDIDNIGGRELIDTEIKRYNVFSQDVLGEKMTSPRNTTANVRVYAKYILEHGTSEEKRRVLEKIKSTVVISDRAVARMS